MPPVPTIVTGQRFDGTVGRFAGRVVLSTGGALGGAGLGALVGTMVTPGIGTMIGSAVGAGLGGGVGEAAAQTWIDDEENLRWGPIAAMATLSGMTAGASSLMTNIGRGAMGVGTNFLLRGVVKTAEVMTAAGQKGMGAIGQRALINIGQGTLYRGIDAAVEGKKWHNVIHPGNMLIDLAAGELIFRGGVKLFGSKTALRKADEMDILAQSNTAHRSAISLCYRLRVRLDHLQDLPQTIVVEAKEKIVALQTVLDDLHACFKKRSAETIDQGFSVWVIDQWLKQDVQKGIESWYQRLTGRLAMSQSEWQALGQQLQTFLNEQIATARFFLSVIPTQTTRAPLALAVDAISGQSFKDRMYSLSISGAMATAGYAFVLTRHQRKSDPEPPKSAAFGAVPGRDIPFDQVYSRVGLLHSLTQQWNRSHLDLAGSELEFRPEIWLEVLPWISGDGKFTPKQLHQLTYDVYSVIHREVKEDPKPSKPIDSECGGEHVDGFTYEANALSKEREIKVKQLADQYLESARFLSRYMEAECEESILSGTKSCPSIDHIRLSGTPFLFRIDPGTKTEDFVTEHCEPTYDPIP